MLGVKLPSGFEIEILEETHKRKYFVLPMELQDDELTDDMLDIVAGGEYDVGVRLV